MSEWLDGMLGLEPATPLESYECAACHGVFQQVVGRREEAQREALEREGSFCEGPMAVVCDDCFKRAVAQGLVRGPA